MAKFNLNLKHRMTQYKNMATVFGIVVIVIGALVTVFANDAPKKTPSKAEKNSQFSGIFDDTFSDSDTQSAMTAQQLELTALQKELASLKDKISSINDEKSKGALSLANDFEAQLTEKITQQISKGLPETKTPSNLSQVATNGEIPALSFSQVELADSSAVHRLNHKNRIHSVRFNYDKPQRKKASRFKSAENYVPSGTFAKAVVLGGADADASVNGARKNNGVMLFKLISEGTLPNNERSHLRGCFITASTYGDISSERAYVILEKISCAHKGRPILDKPVTGWAFFSGKVGIKGHAVMRDGKVVQWAGISGALAGIASAAQYAQSVQSIGPYGATSIVPSSNIASFAGLGGATKAADQLSSYYIKRAEQYHPVIQVGAGNLVNIVFKDGFSLLPEEDESFASRESRSQISSNQSEKDTGIPESILDEINSNKGGYELGSHVASKE